MSWTHGFDDLPVRERWAITSELLDQAVNYSDPSMLIAALELQTALIEEAAGNRHIHIEFKEHA